MYLLAIDNYVDYYDDKKLYQEIVAVCGWHNAKPFSFVVVVGL